VNNASERVPYDLYGRQKGLVLFAEDSYKATSRLTLSMGLRWNYQLPLSRKEWQLGKLRSQRHQPELHAPGLLIFAKNGSDSFEKNEYAKQFGPSFGLPISCSPRPWFAVLSA